MNPLYRAILILSEVEAPLLTDVDEPQRVAFRTRTLVLEPGPVDKPGTRSRHALTSSSCLPSMPSYYSCAR